MFAAWSFAVLRPGATFNSPNLGEPLASYGNFGASQDQVNRAETTGYMRGISEKLAIFSYLWQIFVHKSSQICF